MTKNIRAKKFNERMGFKAIKTKFDIMPRLQGLGGGMIEIEILDTRGETCYPVGS